jgi:hypothetical protein
VILLGLPRAVQQEDASNYVVRSNRMFKSSADPTNPTEIAREGMRRPGGHDVDDGGSGCRMSEFFPRTSRSQGVYKLVFDWIIFIPNLSAVGDFSGRNPQPRDGTGGIFILRANSYSFFLTRVRNGIHCCMFTLCLILFCNTIIRDERHLGVG